jgi:hypothetical protein
LKGDVVEWSGDCCALAASNSRIVEGNHDNKSRVALTPRKENPPLKGNMIITHLKRLSIYACSLTKPVFYIYLYIQVST